MSKLHFICLEEHLERILFEIIFLNFQQKIF